MEELIREKVRGKKVAILGYGREGKSTYTLLRKYLPHLPIAILDTNSAIAAAPEFQEDRNVEFHLAAQLSGFIGRYDLVFKAPGVPARVFPEGFDQEKITSQTSAFLEQYAPQVIGVTGTKGKSTTASLIHHILTRAGHHSLLVGNIGLPPFEAIDDIKPDTRIVMELSSHQLQFITRSPHIGILLNIFQEHLDHYASYEEYQQAKMNIGRYQVKSDYFIYCSDNEAIQQRIRDISDEEHLALPYALDDSTGDCVYRKGTGIFMRILNNEEFIADISGTISLPGEHNLKNVIAASAACHLSGVTAKEISDALSSFNGLEHRIEYVGTYDGILFYNDSIATIPEATIEAVKTLKDVDTLILGGYDRGIDYGILYPFLMTSGIRNLICIGNAGLRMKQEMEIIPGERPSIHVASDYEEVVTIAKKVTRKGHICLLSPAASSYDMFKNFEHRGNIYKKNVRA